MNTDVKINKKVSDKCEVVVFFFFFWCNHVWREGRGVVGMCVCGKVTMLIITGCGLLVHNTSVNIRISRYLARVLYIIFSRGIFTEFRVFLNYARLGWLAHFSLKRSGIYAPS